MLDHFCKKHINIFKNHGLKAIEGKLILGLVSQVMEGQTRGVIFWIYLMQFICSVLLVEMQFIQTCLINFLMVSCHVPFEITSCNT